jgi:uncharacterized membrane protein YjfL (UPF0719 family)
MVDVAINIGWAVGFVLLGGVLGMFLVVQGAAFLPKVFDRLTPDLDEAKEIARGNVAAAEYFGRVVAAGIVGLSIVVGASIVAGIIAALH